MPRSFLRFASPVLLALSAVLALQSFLLASASHDSHPALRLAPRTDPHFGTIVTSRLTYRSPADETRKSFVKREHIPEGSTSNAFFRVSSTNHGVRDISDGAADLFHRDIPSGAEQSEHFERRVVRRDPQDAQVADSLFAFDDPPRKIVYLKESEVILVLTATKRTIYRSADQGKTWSRADVPEGQVHAVLRHPHFPDTAFLLTSGTTHYFTTDHGTTWSHFATPGELDLDTGENVLGFHSLERLYLLAHVRRCSDKGFGGVRSCYDDTYASTAYPVPGFTLLERYTSGCVWARGNKYFDQAPEQAVYCVVTPPGEGGALSKLKDSKLVMYSSTDGGSKTNVVLGEGLTQREGFVVGLAVVNKFVVVAVNPQDETGVELYVSTDGKKFGRAQFPARAGFTEHVSYDTSNTSANVSSCITLSTVQSYTIVPSAVHALFVDLDQTKGRGNGGSSTLYGTLYVSDSTGTRFLPTLPHTNHDLSGSVDFERWDVGKGEGVYEGVVAANVVLNWQEVDTNPAIGKRLTTAVSWDDGRTWGPIKAPEKDLDGNPYTCPVGVKCSLHLHGLTEGESSFSSSAPGVLFGVGSVGEFLLPKSQSDTFMSINGGADWFPVMKGDTESGVGDQGGIVVLGQSGEIRWSKNYGKTWITHSLDKLPKDKGVFELESILTTSDSTSAKFLAVVKYPDMSWYAMSLDFSGVFPKKCVRSDDTSSDFELWKPRDYVGGSDCILGEEIGWYRRKADRDCIVGEFLKDIPTWTKKCDCAEVDFDCDIHYMRGSDDPAQTLSCSANWPNGVDPDVPATCSPGTKYSGKSGYVKKPGDVCVGGKQLDDPVERDCPVTTSPPPAKGVSHQSTILPNGQEVESLVYFPDSPVLFIRTAAQTIWWSGDEGGTWLKVLSELGPIHAFGVSDADSKRVYVFGEDGFSYYSPDRLQGYATNVNKKESLQKISTPDGVVWNRLGAPVVDFHPEEKDWLVWVGMKDGKCPGTPDCYTEVFITKDHGAHWHGPIDTWVRKCLWSRDLNFTAPAVGKDAVYCTSYTNKNGDGFGQDGREAGLGDQTLQLVLLEGNDGSTRTVLMQNVVEFFVISGFLVVAVVRSLNIESLDILPSLLTDASDIFKESNDQLQIHVSKDGRNFKEAQFPPSQTIDKNAFTLLESHPGNLFLDVTSSFATTGTYGMLFSSDSDGAYFTKSLQFTNKNLNGIVDFEVIKGLDGIIIANVVANPTAATAGESKQVVSKISFDNGASWELLPAPKVGVDGKPFACQSTCRLNFHSVSTLSAAHGGTIFSAGSAPGIIMGVGNVGDHLDVYNKASMFISRDGGASWTEFRAGQHLWKFGDHGGLLVIVAEGVATDTVLYSTDYGATWSEYKFSDTPMRVRLLITEPKSTSMRFTVVSASQQSNVITRLDFSQLLGRKCNFNEDPAQGDFEKWSPSFDGGGTKCFLGHEASYVGIMLARLCNRLLGTQEIFYRRKSDAQCYVGELYTGSHERLRNCPCTVRDFECDHNYWRDETTHDCVLAGPDPLAPADCAKGSKYMGRSGYRKIAISTCEGGMDLEKQVEKICGEDNQVGAPAAGILKKTTIFPTAVADWLYFEDSRTLMIRDIEGVLRISYDEGSSWSIPLGLENLKCDTIIANAHLKSQAFFLGQSKTIWYTEDKGKTFKSFVVPFDPNTLNQRVLQFHSSHPGWWIFVGSSPECAAGAPNDRCEANAFYTQNAGLTWKSLTNYVDTCVWGSEAKFSDAPETLVFCHTFKVKEGNQKLLPRTNMHIVRSEDFFSHGEDTPATVVANNVLGYALFAEFMVVAEVESIGDQKFLNLYVSVDGKTFAPAKFPPNFRVPSHGYTVLESTTGSIFIDVFTNTLTNAESGTLLISNWNGTYYTKAVENTNRDSRGFVDFEKMQGIQGIAMINQVMNPVAAAAGQPKEIRTLISFDDGGSWTTLTPPAVGSDGTKYDCPGCLLNLHSYTERHDPRNQFSSTSAVGLMLAVGNVGPHLTKYNDGNTFLTRDAGKTWVEVHKDAHMYKFGDHGAIIILVNDEEPTDRVVLSIAGRCEYVFVDKGSQKVRVTNILSEPDSTSQQFVLLGHLIKDDVTDIDGRDVAIYLNFEALRTRQCTLDMQDPSKSDFELWSPQSNANDHPCLFGREVQYYRRKRESECFVGQKFNENPLVVQKSCKCTVHDFQCDYNFVRAENGSCVLADGAEMPQTSCKNGWYGLSTGYRKTPLSACLGGLTLDVPDHALACGDSHKWSSGAIAGLALGFIGVFAGAGYYMYTRAPQRIMLPDDESLIRGSTMSRGGPGFMRQMEPALQTAGQYVRAVGELSWEAVGLGGRWVVNKVLDGYDWVVDRLRGRRYQSVATTDDDGWRTSGTNGNYANPHSLEEDFDDDE
ncbi:vacuolar protein sorting/targeting protein PEP1 [Gonapodya sp. JEL0774]|nr:vacuolar protein sorting/targeting protein PEP1 [Gonapodya sp. JEL0774]